MEKLKEIAQNNYLLSTNNIYLSQNFVKKYNSELTDLQKKLIFFALSNIKNEHRDLTAEELANSTFYLKVDNFIKLMNLKKQKGGDLYKRIKDDIELLQKTPLKFIDEFGGEHSISWFSRTIYYSKDSVKKYKEKHKDVELEDTSYFILNFTEHLSHMLVNLKDNYTKYNFLISHSLKSKSARVYELLQTWKETKTYITTVEDFCYSLSLAKSYYVKSQLKKYVLEKVKEELNSKLDLGFDYRFEENKLILTAQKNDTDLCNQIFDVKQKAVQKEEQAKLQDKIKYSGTSEIYI